MSMYLLPEKSIVHGTYATLAGNGISISKPERTHHYTEFLGHVFRTNGLPADLAWQWVSVGANYPRLRSFLANYVPWEKAPIFGTYHDDFQKMVWKTPTKADFDGTNFDNREWMTPSEVMAEYGKGLIADVLAKVNRVILEGRKERQDMLRGRGTLESMKGQFATLDGMDKEVASRLVKAWINSPPEHSRPIFTRGYRDMSDSTIASAYCLWAVCGIRHRREITTMLDTLDTYPWWESIENINKYKDGSK